MRRPDNQQRPGPHTLQDPAENLPLLRARGAYECRDVDDVEVAEVVLRAAGAVAAEG